ncbi:MAG: D-alanyl-D-alanine endopeptidase [Betaproteobacteria bacterium]|nr:D-alanyl-D-alanine endopeptidase [Betaproteobacteria bacterium]
MRHRISWLALRDRGTGPARRRSPLLRLAGLAFIALSLAAPAPEASAARKDKPAVTKKTRAKAASQRKQAVKVRSHAKKDSGRPLKVARVDRSAAASAIANPIEPPRAEARDAEAAKGAPAVSSRTVLVYDETSGQPLFSRNDDHSQPIASITKLMTAMVVLDAKLPMDEKLSITWDDVDHLRGSSSRVPVGAELTREELLRLALMSSENRAAAALGRNYPGGMTAFVRAMNVKAAALGMRQSRFEDSTGLHGGNRASAMDLVRMVQAAHEYAPIREFSTTGSHSADLGRKHVEFRNTNALVRSPDWDIGISKTGYIREAGRCLVMHARIAARPVVIVLLDGDGKYTRIGDASRIKKWLEARWRGDLLASNT